MIRSFTSGTTTYLVAKNGISKLKLFTPKYIIGNYFDTKLSMFGLALYATEEGAKGPQ